MATAYRVNWTEYERDWGMRPDGSTLHKDKATAEQYIKDYWDRMPDRGPNGEVPDEYSAPGEPHPVTVDAEKMALLEEKGSFWL